MISVSVPDSINRTRGSYACLHADKADKSTHSMQYLFFFRLASVRILRRGKRSRNRQTRLEWEFLIRDLEGIPLFRSKSRVVFQTFLKKSFTSLICLHPRCPILAIDSSSLLITIILAYKKGVLFSINQ